MKNSRDDESGISESLDSSSEMGAFSRPSTSVEEDELLEAITEAEGTPPSTEASDMSYGDMLTALISNPRPEARKNFFKGLDKFYDKTVQAAFQDENGDYITDRPIPVNPKEDSPTIASAKHLYNALYYSEAAADKNKYHPMTYWHYGQAMYELSQIDYASVEDISQTMGALYDNVGQISPGSEELGAQIYDHLPQKGKAAANLTFKIDEDSDVPARQQFGQVLTFQQGSLSQSDEGPAVDLSEEINTLEQSMPKLGYQRDKQGLFIHPDNETVEERSEVALLNVLQCALKLYKSQDKFCATRYWNTGKWGLKLKSELSKIDAGALKQAYGSELLKSVQTTLNDIDANMCPIYELSDLTEDQTRVKQGAVSENIATVHDQLQSLADQIGLELPGASTQYLPQRIMTRQRHIEFLQADKPRLEQEQKRVQNCIRLLEKHNNVDAMSVYGAKFLLNNIDLLKLDPDVKEGFRQALTMRIEDPGKSAGVQQQGYFSGTVGTIGKWSGQTLMAKALKQAKATDNRYSAAIKTNESQQIATQTRIDGMFQQLAMAPAKLEKRQEMIADKIDGQRREIETLTDLKNEIRTSQNSQQKPLSDNIIKLLKDNYQQLGLDPVTENEIRDFFNNNQSPLNEAKFYKTFYKEVAPSLESVIDKKIASTKDYIKLLEKHASIMQSEQGILNQLCDFGGDNSEANINQLKDNLANITPRIEQQQQQLMTVVNQENSSIEKIRSLQTEMTIRKKKMKVTDLSSSGQETLKKYYQELDLDPRDKEKLKAYFESEPSLRSSKAKKSVPKLPRNLDSLLEKVIDKHDDKLAHAADNYDVISRMQDSLKIAEDDESSIQFTPDQVPSNVNAQKSLARNIDATRRQLLEKMDSVFDEDVMKAFKDDNGRFITDQYFDTSKPESPTIRACQEILNLLSTAEYALEKEDYDPRKYGAVLKRGGGYGVQYLWGKYGYGEGITQGSDAKEDIQRSIELLYGHSGEGYNELIGTLQSIKPYLPQSLQETINLVTQDSPRSTETQSTHDDQDTEASSSEDSLSDLPEVVPSAVNTSDLASNLSLSQLYRVLKFSYDNLKSTLSESDLTRNSQGNFKINTNDTDTVKTTKSVLNVLRATAHLADVLNPKTYHQTKLKDLTTALKSIDDILTYLPKIPFSQLSNEGKEAIKNVLKTIDTLLAEMADKSDVVRDELMLKEPLEVNVNGRTINYDDCFNAVCQSFNSLATSWGIESTAGNTAPHYPNQRLEGRQQHLNKINEELASLDDKKPNDKRRAIGLNRQKKLIAKRMSSFAPKRSDLDQSPPIVPPRQDADRAPPIAPPRQDADRASPIVPPRQDADRASPIVPPRQDADRASPIVPPRSDGQASISQSSDVLLEGLSDSENKGFSDDPSSIVDELEGIFTRTDGELSTRSVMSDEECLDASDSSLSDDEEPDMTDAAGDLADVLRDQCDFCDEDLPHDKCSEEDGSEGMSDGKSQSTGPFGSGSGG